MLCIGGALAGRNVIVIDITIIIIGSITIDSIISIVLFIIGDEKLIHRTFIIIWRLHTVRAFMVEDPCLCGCFIFLVRTLTWTRPAT